MSIDSGFAEQKQDAKLGIRGQIILSATTLFAKQGFDGASLRDIAQRANVNVAMIAYYFGDKKSLYLECLSQFAQDRTQDLPQILSKPQSAEEFRVRLKIFMQTMLKVYTTDSALLKIIMREMQNEKDELGPKLVGQMTPIFWLVKGFLQSGIEREFLKAGARADYLALIILGSLSHPCHCELAMKETMSKSMHEHVVQEEYLEQFLNMFF